MKWRRKLRRGHAITVVEADGLVWANVAELQDRGQRFRIRYAKSGYGPITFNDWRVQDEGVLWCRGHVTRESEYGAALLASAAMRSQ